MTTMYDSGVFSVTQSEQERSCILLLRLETNAGSWIWVHVVLQVKDSNDSSQQPVIVCTNQVLRYASIARQSLDKAFLTGLIPNSEKEATVMRANSWLYQFYSLHSKMHYGLTYEAHTTRLPTYYPPTGVMSHAYPHPHHQHTHANSTTTGGAETASVPIPYHIHSAITPLNGTAGHRHPHHPHHPQAVLQYSPQAGSLPYPTIVTAVNANAQTISDEAVKQTAIKRSFSPHMTSQSEQSREESESPEPPNKRSNVNHHNLPPPPTSTYHHPRASTFAYPTSMFGAGGFATSSMTSVPDFGSVMPGYYGGPQVLASVPYHTQIGHHFRNQSKMSLLEESESSCDQSLTPSDEYSNLIPFSSPSYLKYTSSLMPYTYPELPDRDLEKVRSPESVVSNTSDYGSMTSQSPPSAFEKPSRKENIALTNNNVSYETSVNSLVTNSNNLSNGHQMYPTLKTSWTSSPIYTDLSKSRPSYGIHSQADKDLEVLDPRLAFPNVIWSYNSDNSSMNQLSVSSGFDPHLSHQYLNEMRRGESHQSDSDAAKSQSANSAHAIPGGHGGHGGHVSHGTHPQHPTSLVSAPHSGHESVILQTGQTADIPPQSSSPISTATVMPALSSSSCGVGRAAGYGSIAKTDRSTRATAQDST